mmetsp:Transcript_25320/g.100931  ORF Transcript_25320/g.100931 Transcript_25320/m.100931 type:complete len:491 (+) Transcript_25320:1125-2597(+)
MTLVRDEPGILDQRVIDLDDDHVVRKRCPTIARDYFHMGSIVEYRTRYGIDLTDGLSLPKAAGGLDAMIEDGELDYMLAPGDFEDVAFPDGFTEKIDLDFLEQPLKETRDARHQPVEIVGKDGTDLTCLLSMNHWEFQHTFKLKLAFTVSARARPETNVVDLAPLFYDHRIYERERVLLMHATSPVAATSISKIGLLPAPAQGTQRHPIAFAALGGRFDTDADAGPASDPDDCGLNPASLEFAFDQDALRGGVLTGDAVRSRARGGAFRASGAAALCAAKKIYTNSCCTRGRTARDEPLKRERLLDHYKGLGRGWEAVTIPRNAEHFRVLVFSVDVQNLLGSTLGSLSHQRSLHKSLVKKLHERIRRDGNTEACCILESFASVETGKRDFSTGFRASLENAIHGDNSQVEANNRLLGKPVLILDFKIARASSGTFSAAKKRAADVRDKLVAAMRNDKNVLDATRSAITAARFATANEALMTSIADALRAL